ncbi:MAG TPA: hypothetical protein ENL23_03570, partial [Candidatus Acetothermia bacterium]|nr:hypothetical protein [Candidatus Acetothermia bacterium]
MDRQSMYFSFLLIIVLFVAVGGFAAQGGLGSDHFIIRYETSGADAVDVDYATTVRDALEGAYSVLTDTYGFPLPYQQIEVVVASRGGGELGSEYMDTTDPTNPVPIVTIAPEAEMRDAIGRMYVHATIDGLVRSTAAHEVFHVVQDTLALARKNDMSDQPFVEPLAVWAQEQVYPDVNDYLEDGLDLLLAPDSIDFFYRTYDAGIFWVFLSSRHGGADAIKRVMAESAIYDGCYAIDAAFRDQGLSFDDLWEEFAIAVGMNDLPDREAISGLFHSESGKGKSKKHDADTVFVAIPASTYEGTWNGGSLLIDRVNAKDNPPYELKYTEDPAGTLLRVAHAYGIDYLRLRASTDKTMRISFSGDAQTAFRADVALVAGDTYTAHSLAEGKPIIIESPD